MRNNSRGVVSFVNAGERLDPRLYRSRKEMAVSDGETVRALATTAVAAGNPAALQAQSVEFMPFGGYRFGGDFFEIVAEHAVDLDGAPALGFVLNVPLSEGLQVEALVTHQSAHVSVPPRPFDPPTRWQMTVDHVQGGALQELNDGRVRPFMTGVVGLTRYAALGDGEIRFTVGAGGGVKLFPLSHVGVRLDGRVYSTFVDANATFLACGPGLCATALHVDIVCRPSSPRESCSDYPDTRRCRVVMRQ
jgi:hypothetical protein